MLFPVDLEYVRSINDSIHGSIRLSNDEVNIIEHRLFRRLHKVRQNSFLYNVFPTAKHTRFEHSIGVMYCAHLMLTALLENGTIARQRNDIANEGEFHKTLSTGVGVDLYQHIRSDEPLLKSVYQDLRIAALLHDIGHGPLSHLFDSYAPNIDEFKEIMNTDKIFEDDPHYPSKLFLMLDNHEKEQKKRGKVDVRIEHEHVSSYFAYKILVSLKYDTTRIHRILTILKPELELENYNINVYGRQFNLSQLLTDIVAGAPIDCDRMDYLKRDSASAGVPYGNYSEDRVLKTLLPYAQQGAIRLGLKTSGLHAIESVLIARYQMYVQVYGHKTNEACNAMLGYIGKGERLSFKEWSGLTLTSDLFEELYVQLSDEGFLNELKHKLQEKKQEAKYATIEDLQNRNLWKRIYEVEEYVIKNDEVTRVREQFDIAVEKMKSDFGHENIEPYTGERFPLKDLSKVGARLMEKKSNSYYQVSEQELRRSSQIIESLNKGLRIQRIYALKRDDVATYKKYANEYIHPLIKSAEEGITSH